ncbi:MAG TPA: flagellar protein FlgN [Steroidobacteraceae bacterium]|jgi:flagellar biosynthesis/type III secretory pathway chaperone|nr:flagellar protein FlgN [Steroidobacteraceae bacterium]
MSLDRADVRRHLEQILTEESGLLVTLQTVLEAETAIVSSEDATAIANIGSNRQRCVDRLFQLGEERSQTSHMLSFGSDPAGLESMFEWADPSRHLRNRWSNNLQLARHCKALNERNGAIVAAKLDRVQQLLQKLRGTAAPAVYSARPSRYTSLGSRDLGFA